MHFQKRFEGTQVNIDTFMAWKVKFDAEMNEIKRQKGIVIKGTKGLTGMQWLAHWSTDLEVLGFLGAWINSKAWWPVG